MDKRRQSNKRRAHHAKMKKISGTFNQENVEYKEICLKFVWQDFFLITINQPKIECYNQSPAL